MSEKRFFTILADDEYTLIQEKGDLRATYLKYSEVVDLLNEQQSTIKHLEDYCGDLEADVKRLMKENKELGKNFDDLVKWATEIAKRNVVLDERIGEQQATITNLQGDVERLKYIIDELRKDNYNKFELINKMKKEEKLYAKEILRLNELNKQTSEFTDILGGY